MLIFSHRGIGFGGVENSLESITAALRLRFNIEIDLRHKEGKVILSHDTKNRTIYTDEFHGLLRLIEDNPGAIFALHIKEDSPELFRIAEDYLKPFRNFFLFVTDFPQSEFITGMSRILGKSRLALYVDGEDLELDLIDKVEFLWLDESRDNIYEGLKFFSGLKKKIICCSPELFMSAKDSDIGRFKGILRKNWKDIFGICTDYSLEYSQEFNAPDRLPL